ncbi:hypothetical protein MAPG_01561 [Magnaporthiopsis poae ATCC 64411]|uniref:Uncharacterized protein n=1 Tax=Magnaporthiopsis poae (strain ATCC 64411 / 73-15) TaxID=644358 RepID=A0A0C4DP11_MAGP6|nr:hypothetical protein MAPG_01561 [Magnaporthiopsis poae ATCC 64411]
MFWRTFLPAGLLFAQAHAALEAMAVDDLMGTNSGVLEKRQELFPSQDGDIPATIITKRQATGVTLNRDGTINMTAWDEIANKACREALTQLPHSTNPSGTCVCYNLPALNNVTGAFEADLRLYQLTAPTGEFAGIPQQNIQVGLQYNGASVSPIPPAAAASMRISARQEPAGSGHNLRILQTYMFVGQIDKDRMTLGMSMATLEALVMPTVTLAAVNPTGQTVTTNVSSNEAAFVAGVFSDSIVMSEFSVANMAVEESLRQLANSTVPFVLPGVQLMIFPFGLIICSIWLVGFVGAVGWGTIERMGFRDQYKRRIALQGKGGMARI